MSHPDKGTLSVSQAGTHTGQVLWYGPSTGQEFLESAGELKVSRAMIGTRQASQAGTGAQEVSLLAFIQQKMSKLLVTVPWCCRHRAGITDCHRYRADVRMGLVQDSAAGCGRGTEQVSQSKRGMEQLSQAIAVIGQVLQAGKVQGTSWYRHIAGVTGLGRCRLES
jgi:hypothetical protein